MGVFEGAFSEEGIRFAAGLVKRFSKARDEDISEVKYWRKDEGEEVAKIILVDALDEDEIQQRLIKNR